MSTVRAATWIYSEFDTNAPFAGLAGWVDPRNWRERSPLLFKTMEPVGGVLHPTVRARHQSPLAWGVSRRSEVVRELNTLLHCDYFSELDRAVGMTTTST